MRGGDKDSLRFPFLKGPGGIFQYVRFWENIPDWEGF
jgi:hypothetical protein